VGVRQHYPPAISVRHHFPQTGAQTWELYFRASFQRFFCKAPSGPKCKSLVFRYRVLKSRFWETFFYFPPLFSSLPVDFLQREPELQPWENFHSGRRGILSTRPRLARLTGWCGNFVWCWCIVWIIFTLACLFFFMPRSPGFSSTFRFPKVYTPFSPLFLSRFSSRWASVLT